MISQLLQPYLSYIALGSAVLSVICLILAIAAISANRRMRRRLQQWKAIGSATDLEDVFTSTTQAVAALRQKVSETEASLHDVQAELKTKVSTPAMRRYNAFAEVGSDLSYSVALLDDVGDGVVLTSIYGRDDSVTYGKPVQGGDSDYLLTAEEQSVIRAVIQNKAADKVAVKTS